MKRPHDFDGGGEARPAKRPAGPGPGPRREGGKGGGTRVDLPFVLKILMPEALASGVIGRGGSVIKHIRESTGAKLSLSEHNELYPGTDCRICTAQAASEAALIEVCGQVAAKLAECAQTAPSEQLGFSATELRLRALLPRAAVSGLIGKGGSAIKQLREESGAKVSVGDADATHPAADQVVSITGPQSAIEYVMGEVNKQVQALNQEAWFVQWASSTPFGGAPGGYGGGGGRDRDRGGGDGHHHRAAESHHHRGGESHHHRGADHHGGAPRSGGFAMPPADWSAGNGRLGSRANGDMAGGPELMASVAASLPEYVMYDQRGFALSCIVPSRLVGGLIGRGGSGTKDVQHSTGTKIAIREIAGDVENKTLNISGPLSNTCAAYMLMMKRYLDAEAQINGLMS